MEKININSLTSTGAILLKKANISLLKKVGFDIVKKTKIDSVKKVRVNSKAIKINIKKKKIPARIRMTAIVLLSILTIFSGLSALATTQDEPGTVEKTIPVCTYSMDGKFYYTVHLTENTVYDLTTLLPGQAAIFKKITDSIDASFQYDFDCDHPYSSIDGSYIAKVQLETNIWKKEYTIRPRTNFESDNFTIEFPINVAHYENIVDTINKEIEITAQNPMLNYTCAVTISVQTNKGRIYEVFTPQLSIPLGKDIIDIQGNLTQSKSGAIETTIEVPITTEDEEEGSNNSVLAVIIFFIPLIPLALLTQNDYTKLDETEKQIQKIMKKYGEWIVKTNRIPEIQSVAEVVHIESLDDLVKTSEELGKPIIYYSSIMEDLHIFYVIDNAIYYEYII